MAILHYRKLASESEAGLTTIYNCTSCDDYSPPPPAAAAAASPDESAAHTNHAILHMVSAACVLGVAFLLLTTCTILLRHRWSRLRSSRRVASTSRDSDEDQSPVDHPIWHIVTVGLPQSVIDSITAVSYKSRDGVVEGSDCSVCLTGFEDGDGVRLLPKCGHAFHLPCIDTWLRSHKNCPLCRAPVVNDSNPNSGPSENLENPREQTAAAAADDNDDSDTARVVNEDLQPVRRSISLDSPAAYEYECAVNKANVLIDVGLQNGEGSSKQQSMAEDGGDSAISRMMKRSLSSSAKILSPFRGSKSQSSSSSSSSSTLPL